MVVTRKLSQLRFMKPVPGYLVWSQHSGVNIVVLDASVRNRKKYIRGRIFLLIIKVNITSLWRIIPIGKTTKLTPLFDLECWMFNGDDSSKSRRVCDTTENSLWEKILLKYQPHVVLPFTKAFFRLLHPSQTNFTRNELLSVIILLVNSNYGHIRVRENVPEECVVFNRWKSQIFQQYRQNMFRQNFQRSHPW